MEQSYITVTGLEHGNGGSEVGKNVIPSKDEQIRRLSVVQ